jgi:hypothetical protein
VSRERRAEGSDGIESYLRSKEASHADEMDELRKEMEKLTSQLARAR